MQLTITRLEGRRNDLVLRLDRAEIDSALLSIANRERLRALPGIPRHRTPTPEEAQAFDAAKVPIEEHLRRLGIVEPSGGVRRRAVAVTNRNLGANHGHLAWQRSETPHIFHIAGDPCDYAAYACLVAWRPGCALSIEDLRFDISRQTVARASDGRDLADEIEWASFGQRVLRSGSLVPIDEIVDQFYDIRHVLAFDASGERGEAIRREIYEGYPSRFGERVRRAWRDLGAPRARYVHNAIGTSADELVILQREGTIEEIGAGLIELGAKDGLILDNGGSVACWVWWVNAYAGGLISPTVDYRPPGTSAIAFVLRGPVNVDLPGGSVSYSVL